MILRYQQSEISAEKLEELVLGLKPTRFPWAHKDLQAIKGPK